MEGNKGIEEIFDERAAVQAILALLSQAAGRGLQASIEHREGQLGLRLDDLGLLLIIVPAPDSKRPLIARAAERAIKGARAHDDALPAVVAPYMTPAGIEAAEELGVGWFDLAGNGVLLAPSKIFLHVEGRKPARRPRGRPSSAFAPRSSRVSRMLLMDPTHWWTQKELTTAAQLPQPTVSRTLTRLRELGLVRHDEERRAYRVTSPGDLLDAWSDEYSYHRHHITPIHLTGGGVGLARHVITTLRRHQIRCGLTGMPAAWLYDRFAQFRLGSCYVNALPSEVVDLLEARIDPEGANFHLLNPDDEGVFFGMREVEELPCVHPVQVYLDLASLPERSAEAADRLRHDWLEY